MTSSSCMDPSLPFVPYDYPEDMNRWSGIVLVGEAPGKDEVLLGHPFAGRSGKLLNEALEKAGIERKDCLVANVFRFRPPQNKVAHFFSSRKAAKNAGLALAEELGSFGSLWCIEEYAKEIEALAEGIRTIEPKIVLALGRTPFWALTGENGLLTHVGKRFPCRFASGIPVMPTYHPSFILRGNWNLQDAWIEHMRTAALDRFYKKQAMARPYYE